MKLAFLDLPDERVDLISRARHDANIEIVLVAHPDPEALALKIAEVLQIPRSTEPLDLLALKPDRVALPSLASPSASSLVRAGISDRIFVTLEDLSNNWPSEPVKAPAEPPQPIESWDNRYDEETGASRLNRIRDVSVSIAVAVMQTAQRSGLATRELGGDLSSQIRSMMFQPDYANYTLEAISIG